MISFLMITFYLMRHGTRESRDEETSLNDQGKKDTLMTAHFLKNQNISTIYASPLKRTRETAQIIAEKLKIPVIIDTRLKERMIFDKTKELSFEEFLSEWDKTMFDRYYRPLYGDSSNVAGKRMKHLIDEISEDNKKVLIVSHGGVIGDLLRTIFSDHELIFKQDTKPDIHYIEIDECSLTEIEKIGTNFILKRVNNTEHLHT